MADLIELKKAIISRADISREKCQRSFAEFFRQSWHIYEPVKPLKWNWHIDAIAQHLEAVQKREITRLIINIPPGCLKSSLVSVAFPPWVWTQGDKGQSTRFLTSSGAMDLATRDCLRSRRIIESDWYQARWGDRYKLTSDQNTKTRYDNDKTGCRIALSTEGKTTGERGDVLTWDDPHDVSDAMAVTGKNLQKQGDWLEQIFSTRVNAGGAIVGVMQRVHEKDAIGRILKKGGYEHLCLPMEYEPKRSTVTCIGFTDPRTAEGELLVPNEYDKEHLEKQKTALGSYGYEGQYQQRPAPRAGGIIQRDWWRFYRQLPAGYERMVMQSWDTAYTAKGDNWAMISASWIDGRLWLLPQGYFCKPMDTPDGEKMIHALYNRDKPYIVLIEKKSSGQSIAQNIQRLGYMPLKPITVFTDKIQRASVAAPKIEAGLIMLPDPEVYPEAAWVAELIESCAAFPAGAHDDNVDALTQLINYVWSLPQVGVRLLTMDDDKKQEVAIVERPASSINDDNDDDERVGML